MHDKTIGIIGGMGPEATAIIFQKLIKATGASKDQDHFRIVIDSNPKIPDRTAAILGKGPSPVKAIVSAGKNLEKIGADIALIPCNTSHYFFDQIQAGLKIPLVNMIKELGIFLNNSYPQLKRVGLLATTGTVKTRLYEKYIDGIQLIYPNDNSQEDLVMTAIYGDHGIKSGNTGQRPRQLLIQAANELIAAGANLVIAGCTEISLALRQEDIEKPLIDPMDIVAKAVINRLNERP